MIVRVKVVLNRTVVDSDGSYLQSQSKLYYATWYWPDWSLKSRGCILVVSQLRGDVMVIKTCNVVSASIVTVKQSFIVSQIIGCPVILL